MSVPMYRQFSIAWSAPWGQLDHGLCVACYQPRSGLFPEGSVAVDFALQLPVASGSLTEGPIPPNHDQFRLKYVRLSSYPDDKGPNPCGWCLVHGGKHPLHNPDGVWHQPVANCCDTMSCHVEPSGPPELGDKRLQWHLIQNAQGGFSHMRDTTPYMYRTASVSHITMCTIFIHGFSSQSSNTDPIVDPEEHESTFVAEDDMLPLA